MLSTQMEVNLTESYGGAASVAAVGTAVQQRALAHGVWLLLSLPSQDKEATVPNVHPGVWACTRCCGSSSTPGPRQPHACSSQRLLQWQVLKQVAEVKDEEDFERLVVLLNL